MTTGSAAQLREPLGLRAAAVVPLPGPV